MLVEDALSVMCNFKQRSVPLPSVTYAQDVYNTDPIYTTWLDSISYSFHISLPSCLLPSTFYLLSFPFCLSPTVPPLLSLYLVDYQKQACLQQYPPLGQYPEPRSRLAQNRLWKPLRSFKSGFEPGVWTLWKHDRKDMIVKERARSSSGVTILKVFSHDQIHWSFFIESMTKKCRCYTKSKHSRATLVKTAVCDINSDQLVQHLEASRRLQSLYTTRSGHISPHNRAWISLEAW